MKKTFYLWLTVLIILVSCNKEENDGPSGIWKDSIFITNEGPFQGGTGSVLAYNRQTGEVSADLFEGANGRPLGNIVQSMALSADYALIAVNNSNTVEVVSMPDFKSVATIDSITLPRYITLDGDKAYVSCWDNSIKVISLSDFSIVDQWPAGTGPDEMVLSGEYLFAINTGGYGVDSVISYVNVNDKEIYGQIHVGHRPSGIVSDHNGYLWVLCSGRGWNGFPEPLTDTPGKLVWIDPSTRQIIEEYPFQESDKHPDNLIISDDGKTLFYALPDGIYRFSVETPGVISTPFIPTGVMFYAMGYDPVSDMIFASDPLDYAQNGRIYRFNSADGSVADSFSAGIIPGGFWFNL